jgi:hypothetical protein
MDEDDSVVKKKDTESAFSSDRKDDERKYTFPQAPSPTITSFLLSLETFVRSVRIRVVSHHREVMNRWIGW